MSDHRLAVLGRVDALDAAVEWYLRVSGGAARVRAVAVPTGPPPGGWATYADRGGTGLAPRNSQALVAGLLAGADRGEVADAGGLVLVGVPPDAGFRPHAWRLRGGGAWLGGRSWARRYAILPADAPLGTVVHELGHLLFGWADHHRGSGLGADCLMATGAAAADPAPPCPPTLVGAGWVTPTAPDAATTVAHLSPGAVLDVRGRLVAVGPSGHLLVFAGPTLVGRVEADPSRPVLALVAPLLRPDAGASPAAQPGWPAAGGGLPR